MPAPAALLLDSFCTLSGPPVARPGHLRAPLRLHADHAVFSGHFPNRPVVPGVCMLALVKELLQQHLGKALLLRSSQYIKFLHPIDPFTMPTLEVVVNYTLQPGSLDLLASVEHSPHVLCRLAGSFQTDFL